MFKKFMITFMLLLLSFPALIINAQEPSQETPFFEATLVNAVGTSGDDPYGILIEVPEDVTQTAFQLNEVEIELSGGTMLLWRGQLFADVEQLEQALANAEVEAMSRRRPEGWDASVIRGVIRMKVSSPAILAKNGGKPFTVTIPAGVRLRFDTQIAESGENPFAIAPISAEEALTLMGIVNAITDTPPPPILQPEAVELIIRSQPLLLALADLNKAETATDLLLAPHEDQLDGVIEEDWSVLEAEFPYHFLIFLLDELGIEDFSEFLRLYPDLAEIVMENLTLEEGGLAALDLAALEDPQMATLYAALIPLDERAVDYLISAVEANEALVNNFDLLTLSQPSLAGIVITRLETNPGSYELFGLQAASSPEANLLLINTVTAAPAPGNLAFVSDFYTDNPAAAQRLTDLLVARPDELAQFIQLALQSPELAATLLSMAANDPALLESLRTLALTDSTLQQLLANDPSLVALLYPAVASTEPTPEPASLPATGGATAPPMAGVTAPLTAPVSATVLPPVDADGDGFPEDGTDLCATVAGTLNGCPDVDADGFPENGTDVCPAVAGTLNGCPDADADGFPENGTDVCPAVAGAFSGCPDADGDGFPENGADACPVLAGTVNGCPDVFTVGAGGIDAASTILLSAIVSTTTFMFNDTSTGYWTIQGTGIETFNFAGVTIAGVNLDMTNSVTHQNLYGSLYVLVLANMENAVGSNQADWIAGNSLNNTIEGGLGSDLIYGNSGSDIITDVGGDDIIMGEGGDDTLTDSGGGGIVYGGTGNDTITVIATGDIDILGGSYNSAGATSHDGNDTISVSGNMDVYINVYGGNWNAGGNGDDGLDTITFDSSTTLTAYIYGGNWNDATAAFGAVGHDGGGDQITLASNSSGVQQVYGGNYNLVQTGDGGSAIGNDIFGNDTLYDYGAGNDALFGGNRNTGNDIAFDAYGDDGTDFITLFSGAVGVNTVFGGNNTSSIMVAVVSNDGVDTIIDNSPGGDTLYGGNWNSGSVTSNNSGGDTITLSAGSGAGNTVYGGNLNVSGADGDDLGTDLITNETTNANTLYGGNNNAAGSSGNDEGDVIESQAGSADTIVGDNFNNGGIGTGDSDVINADDSPDAVDTINGANSNGDDFVPDTCSSVDGTDVVGGC